jgi:hypothetical protein
MSETALIDQVSSKVVLVQALLHRDDGARCLSSSLEVSVWA